MSESKVFGNMDPADDDAFWARFETLLGGSDTVLAVNSLTLDATSIASNVSVSAGTIVSDPKSQRPATAVQFTLGVATGDHNNAVFDKPSGLSCNIAVNVTTANGRTLERTVIVPIVQS